MLGLQHLILTLTNLEINWYHSLTICEEIFADVSGVKCLQGAHFADRQDCVGGFVHLVDKSDVGEDVSVTSVIYYGAIGDLDDPASSSASSIACRAG